jgi:hypothetical protein
MLKKSNKIYHGIVKLYYAIYEYFSQKIYDYQWTRRYKKHQKKLAKAKIEPTDRPDIVLVNGVRCWNRPGDYTQVANSN